MLEVRELSKSYGGKRAVDGISFSVGTGEILGFLGPNGAGKSTTMNMITGYLASTSGEVYIEGISILEQPLLAKKRIGYLPEKPPLYVDMTVEEYLRFVCALKRVELPWDEHIREVCRLTGLEQVCRRLIRNLSKGYCQRVGVAQALLGYPPLLILDEPTSGLDPKQIVEIRSLIERLGGKHTIILSTHILSEVQSVCSRIVVINQGRIAADGAPEQLLRTMGSARRLRLDLAAPEEEAGAALAALPGVVSVERRGETEPGVWSFFVEQMESTDVRRALSACMAERGWPIMELGRAKASLEDLFLTLTDGADKEE